MGTYFILIKVKKEYLNLKAVIIIYTVTGWSEIVQYDNK